MFCRVAFAFEDVHHFALVLIASTPFITQTHTHTHTHLIVYPKRSFDALFVLCSCLLVLFDQTTTVFDTRRVRS